MDISNLFHRQRLVSDNLLWNFLLLVYMPIGILLAVIRLFLCLQLTFLLRLLPKEVPFRRWWYRGVQPGLGFWVTVEGQGNRDESVKTLVANHVSIVDHAIVESLVPCIAVRLPTRCPILHGIMGHGRWSASENAEVLSTRLATHSQDQSSLPVLIHPENGCTNGQGLMQFRSWPFSGCWAVQPIALSVWRPFPIAPTYLGSTIIPDLFFHLFVPFTCYRVRYLEPMEKQGEETAEEFAARVQQTIADSLGVEATQHTTRDRAEYVKRLQHDSREQRLAEQKRKMTQRLLEQQNCVPGQRIQVPSSASEMTGLLQAASSDSSVLKSGRLRTMVSQVREVLPYVPEQAIMRDLATTNCVDTTISNILDGRVAFTPESEQASAARTPSRKEPPATPKTPDSAYQPDQMKFGADKFSRSPIERQASFQDRKQQMVNEARRRYLEKQSMSSPP